MLPAVLFDQLTSSNGYAGCNWRP